MKTYSVKRLEMQNSICQWVEVYCNGSFKKRLLVGKDESDSDIIEEYFNSISIDAMFERFAPMI